MENSFRTTCTSSNEYYTACRNIMLSCKYCHNAFIDGELTSENDLSYCSVGDSDKNYNIMFRTGDGRKTGIVFSKYSERYKRNIDVGYYYPKYCPECGRRLIENEKKEYIEPINQTIISITPPNKSIMELVEKLPNGLSWKSYNKDVKLDNMKKYLIVTESPFGLMVDLAWYVDDLSKVIFDKKLKNKPGFYKSDTEYGNYDIENVHFYVDIPEIPKE